MRIAREVRDLLQPADPARALSPTGTPPGIAPAAAPRRRRSRRLVIAVAALTVAASATLTVIGTLPGNGQAYALTPTPLPMTENGPAAHDTLLGLAAAARAAAADPPPADVDFLRQRAWAMDSTLDGDDPWSAIVPYELRLWRRADGSGRTTTTWLPPERTYPDPLPLIYRLQLPSGTDATTFGPGHPLPGGTGPLATDVAGLRPQIYATNPEGNGPKSAVRGVCDLYQYWRVPRDTRVAALRVLAGVPELRDGGRTTDRSGRPGIAVYLEQGGVRDTLVLDESTGAVLAYEMTLLADPGALPELRYPAVVHYITFLEARPVDRIPG